MDNATMFGALAVLAVPFLSYFFAKWKEIATAQQNKRREGYAQIVDMLIMLVKHIKNKGARKISPEMEGKWFETTKGLTLWASPKVVQKWRVFRKGTGENPDPDAFKFVLDDLLREIRRDLGNSNKGLARGDLVDLFMSEDAQNPPEK